MEEEMRKIEEEFAFQEKWIKIFKRGKFFLQNIPELLILRIITKMEAKAFFNLLRTGKWMHLLCRENRDSLLISFKISNYDINYVGKRPEVVKKKRNQDIQQLRKVIRSKYYFFVHDGWHGSLMEDLYSKEAYHFRRECWNIKSLRINKVPINMSIINHLQPIILAILMNQNGPLSENFNIPARTKDFFVKYASISDSDFYKEIERFGLLPLKATFRRDGHLEFAELFSILKGITQEKHLHHPLQFLTYKRESRSNYAIFDSWPMDSFFPSSESNFLFYFIIVAKSDVGVSVIHLYRFPSLESEQLYTLQIMEIKSFDEWEKFTKRDIADRYFDLEAGQTYEKSDKQLAEVLEVFSAQVASKFFEGGKLVYPPLVPPEPAPEFVKFLKKFEDFDIQPEKLAPHKSKWKKTEKLPDLPRKLPEIHSNNWLIEAKEVIKLRKFWLDFLQKGKFILELLPHKNLLDIAKKMHFKQFPLFFSTTKWIHNLIERSTPRFRVHGGRCTFNKRWDGELPQLKQFLAALEYFYLEKIRFLTFKSRSIVRYIEPEIDLDRVRQMLAVFKEREIYARTIYLFSNCPLIEDLFEFTARRPEKLFIRRFIPLPGPIEFPPELKEITVEYEGEYLSEIIDMVTGIEQQVILRATNEEMASEAIIECIEQLKIKKCKSNVSITNIPYDYEFIEDSDRHFDLSQISETVFIFRSMARGRGGVWNYFIRLEKAGSGAVGIAYYLDSIQNEEDKLHQFNIRCEYFPTMESFLDYFEREVGSKRRARDWMQLREKDGTIDPREKDFKKFKKLTPFIHFNEQKEVDDLKEVRRRFFT